ncbi:unnamed protein product [Callosobruchus maculatus]|uniref:Uncharacterized protein n=1 Tax=Callosobruchus maculatus TaxID=64391 RepID=A0A653DDJ6_CALMS|nr:unnamed protein product [Callosobruchus maculatus]
MKLLLIATTFLSVICLSHTAEKLKVAVYYESVTSDHGDFFRQQLLRVYEELEEYLDLDLVPFGKGTAKKHGDKWKFECEHGPKECEANAYHSCAVDIATTRQALKFAECAFIQFTPTSTSAMKWCGKRSGITYASLDACRQKRGDELLAANAEKSKNVGYQTVPAVAFNGKYDPMESDIATKNLKKIICSKLKNVPPQCKQHGEH